MIGAKENEVCILDPSLENGKFESPERRGKVRMDGFLSIVARRYWIRMPPTAFRAIIFLSADKETKKPDRAAPVLAS